MLPLGAIMSAVKMREEDAYLTARTALRNSINLRITNARSTDTRRSGLRMLAVTGGRSHPTRKFVRIAGVREGGRWWREGGKRREGTCSNHRESSYGRMICKCAGVTWCGA